jgi:hypothetical protein
VTQPAAGDPAYASTAIGMWRASAGKPIGRIVATGTQTLNDDTLTAIAFSAADEIDTHGWHDPTTNNTRITPNVEGYIRFFGTVFFNEQTTPVSIDANWRKNGSTAMAPAGRMPGSSTIASTCSATVVVSMNGTTDYMELMGRQNSAGNDTTHQSAQFSSVVEWEFVRPL